MANHVLSAPTAIGNGTVVVTPHATVVVTAGAVTLTPPVASSNGQVDNSNFQLTIKALIENGWRLTSS